jgi:hypothetical protein
MKRMSRMIPAGTSPVGRLLLAGLAIAAGALGGFPLAPAPAAAQWSTVYEQTYLPASHNWAFRRQYNAAERLTYAFDYGHAILYETLWTRPNAPPELLEERIYDRLTRRILVRPPHVPLEEGAIEIAYAKLAPEAKVMFDWAHILHRQVYDVWADERIPVEEKDRHVHEILRYYKSRPDIAFSSRPKSMEVMDGQYFSLAFREGYPKFNGLIWAYHWLQVGLYEPLLASATLDERKAGVSATLARFWQMLENAPENMPHLMPMTAAVAPRFAARYPEIAIIFDNLHMMHDVISDILASPEVPRNRKGAEIRRQAHLFRDDTSYVTTVEEWRQMSVGMGVHNQGGPAVGFLAALPTPTVPRGMSMAGMDHGAMDHGVHVHPTEPAPDPHAAHRMPEQAHDHERMMQDPGRHRMMELIVRLLADPRVEARVHADPRLHELWEDPEVQRHLEMMRRMHPVHEGHTPADPAAPDPHAAHRPPAMQHEHGEMAMDPGMHRMMEFVLRLLADPQVEARIHADPRLHELWGDPDLQRHLEMMRRMHAQHEGHDQHQQPRDQPHPH